MESGVEQAVEAGAGGQADEAGGDLRVVDVGRHRAEVQAEGDQVGGRRVHQLLHGGISDQLAERLERRALKWVDQPDRLADGDLRVRIAAFRMQERAFHLTVRRAQAEARAGGNIDHLAPLFKYAAASVNQQRLELLVETLGLGGLGWEGDGFHPDALRATRHWLRSKGNSIEGGTSEINLNVVAKRVLGLPDAT